MLKEGKVSSEASLEMWNWLFAASDPRALLALPVSIPREQHTGTNFYHPNTEGLTREITGILKFGLVGVTLELAGGQAVGAKPAQHPFLRGFMEERKNLTNCVGTKEPRKGKCYFCPRY